MLVNLGSGRIYSEDRAIEMAIALKNILTTTDVQFLWKMNKRPGDTYSDDFLADLQQEIVDGRLRISSWLPIDPAAILETGNVVLSVHHGGANCFHEAIG